MNSFSKSLKQKENQQSELLLQSMEQVKEEKKQKYEQKKLGQLLKNENSLFSSLFIFQLGINQQDQNKDTKQEYLKLIPEIFGETLSEFPFTNFLATYVYEINQEITTSNLVEKNNDNEQGQTNFYSQFIDDNNVNYDFI